MSRLRVLVVEDSLTVRKRLCEVLSADPDIEVVGEALDGHEAVDLCTALKPDVVTMDMMLPRMNGLLATEHIMAHCPTPILVVSAFDRNELFRTFDALAAGAVEVLEKPVGEDGGDAAWAHRLVTTVKLVSRIRVITHLRAKLPSATQQPGALPPRSGTGHCASRLLALGASTGGPAALVRILHDLPAPLPVPLLVVQHIGDDGVVFADWLATQTAHPARYARHGEPLDETKGSVVLAPPNRHLVVQNGRLNLLDEPPLHSCKPAIDYLFRSIAKTSYATCTTACVLTGMGRDGASGLLDIRRAGGQTMAQDEASSVIYGMPREAMRLGAAEQSLSLEDIGPALAASWHQKEQRAGR
jgi:two-component system chemotaxis response regulator CheB